MDRKTQVFPYEYIFKRLKSILLPYCIASIFGIFLNYRMLDFRVIVSTVLTFSADGPYYFVLFFIQLIFVSPFLYFTLQNIKEDKYKKVKLIMLTLVVLFISVFSTKYSFILNVHGGGKYLFGGSYLLVYFIGMIIAEVTKGKKGLLNNSDFNSDFRRNENKKLILHLVNSGVILATFLWQYLKISSKIMKVLNNILPIWSFNPPGTVLLIYTLFVLLFAYSIYEICLYNIKFDFFSLSLLWEGIHYTYFYIITTSLK